MPEYLAPGVYVEEIEMGPVPIEGVSTSTAGFIGMTQRGRTTGLPELVTSFSDFQRKFGGYFDDPLKAPFQGHLYLPFAVDGFFANGGKRAYIMRVMPGTAKAASTTPKGGLTTRLRAGEDAVIGTKTIRPLTLRGIQVGTQITLTMKIDGIDYKSLSRTVSKIVRETESIVLDDVIQFDPLPTKFDANVTSTMLSNGGIALATADAAANAANKKVKLSDITDLEDGAQLQLRMTKNGITYESQVLKIAAGGINTGTKEITFTEAIALNTANPISFDARRTIVTTKTTGIAANTGLLSTGGAAPNSFKILAADEGAWGNNVVIEVSHVTGGRSALDLTVATNGVPSHANGANELALKSGAGFYKGAWIEIDRGDQKRYRKVTSVTGNVITVDGDDLPDAQVQPEASGNGVTFISVCEFRLTVSYANVVEQFEGLTLEPGTGKYFAEIINAGSKLIRIDTSAPPAATHPMIFPSVSATGTLPITLQGGLDGTAPPTDLNYHGLDGGPGKRTGLRAMEDIDQVSILAAPGLTGQVIQSALIEQCTRLMDRFAILDPAPKIGNQAPDLVDIQNQRKLYDSKYAAIYYPRLRTIDPATETEIAIPPSGHTAGIYARTDIERGVHKAPANEVVRNIIGLEVTVNKGEQDILNPLPNNINVIRDFRADGRAYRVWGARCITSASPWKYINVRRLFIYIEESIDEGTQWVVFEPNDEPTWARVRQSVTNFLTRVWRDGALMGATAEQAFFVRCDNTTMTRDDIDNGRLIMIIGIAPVKPAEYVIIRIGQKTGGATVEEL